MKRKEQSLDDTDAFANAQPVAAGVLSLVRCEGYGGSMAMTFVYDKMVTRGLCPIVLSDGSVSSQINSLGVANTVYDLEVKDGAAVLSDANGEFDRASASAAATFDSPFTMYLFASYTWNNGNPNGWANPFILKSAVGRRE